MKIDNPFLWILAFGGLNLIFWGPMAAANSGLWALIPLFAYGGLIGLLMWITGVAMIGRIDPK